MTRFVSAAPTAQRLRLTLFHVLSAVLLLGACEGAGAGEAASADAAVVVDTVGGIEQVTYSGPGAWAAGSPWRADTSGIVRIGAVDGPEPYVFGRISGVVVGGDGRIYVADGQAKEVRVFSATGEYLSRFGREGEGPGEFRDISGMGRAPDGGIATFDVNLSRISVFDGEGVFLRSFRLERPYRKFVYTPVRFGDDGRYYDLTSLSRVGDLDSLGYVRYDPDGAVEDTVLLSVFQPLRLNVDRNGRREGSVSIPHAPQALAAIGPDGSASVAHGQEYRIARIAPSGDTVQLLRRTTQPVPVPESLRDSLRTVVAETYEEISGAPPRDPVRIPEHMPALAALLVDEQGALWALRPTVDPGAMSWDVFDEESGYLGAVEIPPIGVMHIGERTIAGVTYDELGVGRVMVIPIERTGTPMPARNP